MIIVHVVEPFAAGVSVFVRSLTESMPDELHIVVHGERKNEISAEAVKKSFPKKNVRFIRWRSAQRSINPLKDFMALSELYKILRRLRLKNLVDAVHLHSSKSGLLGRIACRMAGIEKFIYTPNGAPFLSGGSSITNFFYQQIEKFGHRIGGEVVCCSASEQKVYGKLGVKSVYVNNGISLNSFTTTSFKKTQETFTVITTGRIENQKNPALFNEIASYFEEFKQFRFIWAGEGQERSCLKSSNIEITGWVSSEEIKRLVTQADVYLSTSVFEGLSFGVLEALAMHKPVLLSECVGNKDVVKKGLNGDIFTNKTEAIVKILSYFNNRDMVDVMGQHSQAICRSEFDMLQNFLGYKRIYQTKKSASDLDSLQTAV
ncbi:glycosyltransferase [Pontibacter cellulosilyticus]|uniref:Glycosyltransferase n=1 Tax=Pontibacter cellulosilyticus TaxID=1720253 RepID=A0A923SI29_9BACT|nr:glycosyltransferase [Pontibacter cellulosilyticus]MBC5992318.1 glycosyltransferase [Pontibacter cellulosilyticus]